MGVQPILATPATALMTCEPTDEELLRRSVGDPRTFTDLVDRHFDAIHRYVHRRAGADIAEELCAETFTIAFEQRAASLRRPAEVRPWLFGISTNLLRRHHRTETRRLRAYARSGVDQHVELDTSAAAARLDAATLGPQLARALGAMRRGERDALLLYALADLGYEEIAEALDVPLGTVRTWLHRARAKATQSLETDRS